MSEGSSTVLMAPSDRCYKANVVRPTPRLLTGDGFRAIATRGTLVLLLVSLLPLAGCSQCKCGCFEIGFISLVCVECCRSSPNGCFDNDEGNVGAICFDSAAPGPPPRSVGGPSYGAPADLEVTTSTDGAGLSPGFTVKFDVETETYQTAVGSVAIPEAYTFNGFLALGPERTQIGLVGLDFDLNDVVEVVTALRASVPANFAYPDLDGNGRYTDGVDPDIEVTSFAGQRFIDFTLPLGGDGIPSLLSYGGTLRVFLYLYPGILVNPMTPDDYMFEGSFTSVDPDSGDVDDFQGTPPLQQNQMVETTVVPSALSLLDPFVCYAAKSSRGNICTAAAPANAGAVCSTETDCGGTIDVTALCVKNKGPVGYQALLADPLETKSFDLTKTNMLCSPGALPGEGLIDSQAQLRDYKIKETKKTCDAGANADEPCAADSDCPGGECGRTPKHVKQPLISVQNALGVLVVSTRKAVGLMTATSIAVPGPAPPLGPTDVDTYKCYSVKFVKKVCAGDPTTKCKRDLDCGIGGVDGPCIKRLPKKFGKSLDDSFTIGDTAFQLKGPKRLCLATAVDGVPPQHPDAHLLCYAAKPLKKACDDASGLGGTPCRKDDDCGDFLGGGACEDQLKTMPPAGVHATNDLGRERIDPKKQKEVCFPSILL